MARSGLRGPFSLTTFGIDNAVTVTSPGAYALGYTGTDGRFYIQYVGRSDDDIGKRLKDWAPTNYAQFKFEYYSSPEAAFEKECELYHDFDPADNTVHPARPKGSNWECPRCSVFD
jgi:hypothetical protein